MRNSETTIVRESATSILITSLESEFISQNLSCLLLEYEDHVRLSTQLSVQSSILETHRFSINKEPEEVFKD